MAIGVYLMFFLIITVQLWNLEEKGYRGKMALSSYQIKGISYQHDLSLLMLTLIISLRSCLSGVSIERWLYCPFPCATLWEESLCTVHTLVGSYVLSPLGQKIYISYFEFLSKEADVPFINLSNSLYKYGLIYLLYIL